jgi:hypothetical protein
MPAVENIICGNSEECCRYQCCEADDLGPYESGNAPADAAFFGEDCGERSKRRAFFAAYLTKPVGAYIYQRCGNGPADYRESGCDSYL